MYMTLANAVATCEYGNQRYLFDVLGLLSRCVLTRANGAESAVLPAWSDRSKITMVTIENNTLAALAHAFLYSGGQRRRISQRLIYVCGLSLWNDLVFVPSVLEVQNDVARRFELIFGPGGVVSECTFKGSGDFIIHTMLQIRDVASHCSCALIKGDNIFGDVARAYGPKANGVVRYYLDKPPVDFIKMGRQTDETLRFITTACVLMEICNDSKTTLLRDREILKKTDSVPQLFVTADAPPHNGAVLFGYTNGRQCFTYSKTIDAIVAYAQATEIASVADVRTALFNPQKLPAQSMLQNYVSGAL